MFLKISQNHDDVDLVILGDGELKKELKNLIEELSLKDKVRLIGYTENIFSYMKNCKCFCFHPYGKIRFCFN